MSNEVPSRALIYDVSEGIATITFNRPDKLNAFNPELVEDFLAALDAIDADDAVRAVIVTGHGRGSLFRRQGIRCR